MSENISLKMGKNLCVVLCIMAYENGDNELQST